MDHYCVDISQDGLLFKFFIDGYGLFKIKQSFASKSNNNKGISWNFAPYAILHAQNINYLEYSLM